MLLSYVLVTLGSLNTPPKILGSFGIKARVGFEVDNALRVGSGEQLWYLVPGYELRALATSSSIPGKIH